MSQGSLLLAGVAIGLGLAGITWLIATGRLRFRWGESPAEPHRKVVVTKTTGRRFTGSDEGEARRFAESLSPDAAQVLDEALRTGQGSERIVVNVNGDERVYDSMEDVPPELRERMQRLRHDGGTEITITVNGETRTYRSRDEVPVELRRLLPPD
jgi:hypothetical protein